MSNGPIEFLGENPAHEFPDTELGGADGLIQKPRSEVLRGDPDASGGHDLLGDKRQSVSERAAFMRRGASVVSDEEAVSGEDAVAGTVVDPATGMVALSADLSKAAAEVGDAAGSMSDLKP